MNFSIAILAGGKSERFPPNKMLVKAAGKPIVEHTVSRIRNASDDVFIVANDGNEYEFLAIPMYSDIHPGRGPISGIHAALHNARYDLTWMVAGDMISIEAGLVSLLIEKSRHADCVIPKNRNGQYEPLCGLYRKSCVPVLEELILAKREYSVLELYKAVRTEIVPWEIIGKRGFTDSLFTNINSREDLERMG